ncbi:MAG: ribosomal-protein-alanine N-acetyltransferase [Deltaproteobacteria bacterium GWA2_38_16]|nr:MAG: ribosomal-protein-alanine N-acetyltransferase [Deltaproteobacteria bacterium GWA2_38_16]OGQ03287.1 MAG: ribosomal-protein-alanine N-acetyltransferase [Deltaproteobacteria bacterium RIFCSPHIGHO2_02_FULL_38_15]OGQ62455.1 MAG: ribosomal-protein-alanine N-acetyltransferase [Deltaproteobacteria bacterium RIFCSPLOWO2_12_FULL_38_8]
MIVKAAESDIAEICAIEQKSFPDPWAEALFQDILNNPSQCFYVAKNNRNHIVGYIIFWSIVDEVHILNLCVAPEYLKQGVGSHLLQFCLEFYKGKTISLFSLEVRTSNSAAQKLYEKFGFKGMYIRKNYYPNHEDALVMTFSPCMPK